MMMKRKLKTLLQVYRLLAFAGIAGIAAGCTDSDSDSSEVYPVEEAVPVQLFARGGALEDTVALTRTEPEEAFKASVAFASASGQYASLTGEKEGIWTADVDKSGGMTWNTEGGKAAPVYPLYGDYLYLVAWAPVTAPTDGAATYALTGQQDLLYVSELRGCKWDGERFYGNTMSEKNKPLTFNHLLTRIRFKACKKKDGGLPVKILKITVNEAKTQAVVPLATGEPAFSTPSGSTNGLSLEPENGNNEVASTTPVELGNLMLPPLDGSAGAEYTLTVETSTGTYNNVKITYGEDQSSGILKAGMSHVVTLTLSDYTLSITSITVEPWELVDAGDLGIGDRD
ncbi:fimbrillin family protein [Bacteroides sp. GD17]|jgi:hypothetical protein|uniref:fimbrillin family protein n=1 Tax=Bacteroides sp. GD17 TaxID=3139826 RepID=UPI0025FDBCBB|nr:fimbrillin family protein [uncultured Bacteroides sp.]